MDKLRKALIVGVGMVLSATAGEGSQWQGGFRSGALFAQTELGDGAGFQSAGFVRVRLKGRGLAEWTAGYGQMKGQDFDTDIWSTDTRFVFQERAGYFYGGAGVMRHSIVRFPTLATQGADSKGWSFTFPVGVGTGLTVSRNVRLDLHFGYTYTFIDDLNGAALKKGNDVFWSGMLGISFGQFSGSKARAKDIVVPVVEAVDNDGDGLTDAEETDYYHTKPDRTDSDEDGLSDFEEVRKYFTNPNVADSDADGVPDREEIQTYETNPHRNDSDGDGLSDGDEIGLHRTDPNLSDTDTGGVPDGDEVIAGTDPLDGGDDRASPVAEPEP